MRLLLPTVVSGAGCAAALPIGFSGDAPTAPDRWAEDVVVGSWLGAHPGVLHALARPTESIVLLPILLIGVVWLMSRGRRIAAVLLPTAVLTAVALNTWVIKPWYGRHFHGHLVYPSGHTVSLVAVTTAIAALAISVRGAVTAIAIGAVAMAGAAIALIGLGYHLLTDILGGIGFGIALPLGVIGLGQFFSSRFAPDS